MKMNQIKIVDGTANDVHDIRFIQKTTWLATYPNNDLKITKQDILSRFADDETLAGKKRIEDRKQKFSQANVHIWVAKDREKTIGFCMAEHEPNNGRLGAIYLLPEYQGQGIGKKLMEMALKWLEKDNDIYVNVVAYNKPAIAFYQRFGFVKTGKEVTDAVAILPSGKILPEIEMVRKTKTKSK